MRPSPRRLQRAGLVALLALLAAYAIQVATPLRLTGDSVIYLTMARSISTGHGIPQDSAFPPGLPGLYALLDVAGAGRSWAIVALNVLALAVAAACTLFLYRRVLAIPADASLLLCCCAFLSYVLVKHAALAMSDVPFLGVASAALALLTVAAHERSGRRWTALAGGVVLVLAALAVRTAGVALVPAAVAAALEAARAGEPYRRWLRRPAGVGAVAGCAVASAALAAVVSGSRYLGQVSESYGGGRAARLGPLLVDHLRNWGELGFNVPETKLPHALHPLLVPAGVLVVVAIAIGLWRSFRSLEPAHVFAVSYLLLAFLWPFADARFWLPLVPLGAGYAFVALRPLVRARVGAIVVGAYVCVFVLLGVTALGYDTRISYSGSRFPERFGSDQAGVSLQPTYRFAFGEPQPGDGAQLDRSALAVLRHWEARARPRR